MHFFPTQGDFLCRYDQASFITPYSKMFLEKNACKQSYSQDFRDTVVMSLCPSKATLSHYSAQRWVIFSVIISQHEGPNVVSKPAQHNQN